MHLPLKPTAALLNQQPFFRGIAWSSLERLAGLASYSHFDERADLRGGPSAEAFYVVLRGSVILEARPATGVATVQSLEPGETLGWSWLFPPYRWSFTARALVAGDALVLPGGILRTRCEEDPVMAATMMRRAAGVMLDQLQATGGAWRRWRRLPRASPSTLTAFKWRRPRVPGDT